MKNLVIRENDFAYFDLIDSDTGKIIASSTHPDRLEEYRDKINSGSAPPET
jgi:hypothetical protein